MSRSAYQCLVLIVCENQESVASEVFCHRFCYANFTHPEKLQVQRIQDATAPATDSAGSISAAAVQGSSEDAPFKHAGKGNRGLHFPWL